MGEHSAVAETLIEKPAVETWTVAETWAAAETLVAEILVVGGLKHGLFGVTPPLAGCQRIAGSA